MAINLSLVEAIQSVQILMKNVATVNEPDNYLKQLGVLNWLFSPNNPSPIQTEMSKTSGASKYRPVEIRYLPRKGTGDRATSDASSSCAKTNTRRESIQILNATLYVEDKFTIDEEIIRTGTLENLPVRLAKEIRDAQRNAREDMDRQLFAAYAGNFGANPAASDRGVDGGVGKYTTLQLLESDGTVDADNFDLFKNDQEDNLMGGAIGILGLGNARKYDHRLNVGGPNEGGVQVDQVDTQFGINVFKDSQTTAVLGGANRVIASYANSSAFFNYNLFGPDFSLDTPDLAIRTTMRDAVYPFNWDFILKYSDECSTGSGLQGEWTGRILNYFNLWIVPDLAFGEPYGPLGDFNGNVGYNITQAA